MAQSDHDYFMRRAVEEREAAERAMHEEARRSHSELARRYEVAAAASIGLQIVPLRTGAEAASRQVPAPRDPS